MTEEYYLYTFESTHGAIATEKLLKPLGCTIMPVPRHISTSCGISVRVTVDKFDISKETFLENTDLLPDEYNVYHITNDKSDKGLGFKFERIEL